MMTGRLSGAGGEHVAETYLAERGAQVLERNYKAAGGEIDLIVRMDGRIVFVEVKARSSERYGMPGGAITPGKIQRVRRAATVYLKEHGGLQQAVRFDAVLVSPDGVKHISGAF